MNSDFPRIITMIRKEKKISQKQAAADLEISQALLSHYEKGIRECRLDFLVRAANYYNVSCDYLLGRTSSPQAHEPKDLPEDPSDISTASEKAIMRFCAENNISENAAGYIYGCIYRLLRIIYNATSGNDELFSISADESEYLSECLISRECAAIKKKFSKCKRKITPPEKLCDSHSLLSLIKLTEEKISEM